MRGPLFYKPVSYYRKDQVPSSFHNKEWIERGKVFGKGQGVLHEE